MPTDRSALDHLLEARDALVREIDRLMTARDELDAVIDRVGTSEPGIPSHLSQPVSARPTGSPARRGGGRGTVRRAAARSGGGPKSIRIHVLELLAADDRDFGMAEIIERIHAQGVRAHDDAVRSITVKLMKDGTVLRVGRGRYRLAERSVNPTTTAAPTATAAPIATVAPAPTAAPAPPPTSPAPPTSSGDAARALNLAQPWHRPEG